MFRACLPPSIISTLEPEYASQCVAEGSTSESENAKEVWVNVVHLYFTSLIFLRFLHLRKGAFYFVSKLA